MSAFIPHFFSDDERNQGLMMKLIKSLLNKAFAGGAALVLTVGASLGAHAAERITYFHNDVSGSPMAATDASGALLWKENYRPYGDKLNNQPASSNNKIGFAGKPFDAAVGLSYMGGRYYDSSIGRFTGTDPQAVTPDDLQSFNRYVYANNNPYRFVDPDGNSPLDVAFLAYDIGKLGLAIWSGNAGAIAEASVDVALSTVGVMSPVPGTGQVLKGLRTAEKTVEAVRGAERAIDGAKSLRETEGAYKRYKAGGSFSKKTKNEVAERAGHKCEYCGTDTVPAKKSQRGVSPPKNEAQTDHIDPRSNGGTNSPDNAAHSCRECNRDFSNKPKPSPRDS